MSFELVVGEVEAGQSREGVDGIWKAFEAVAAEIEVREGRVVPNDGGYLSNQQCRERWPQWFI